MEKQRFKEQFFSQIYDQYIEKIYRFALFKTNSEVLSQDLTAETFSRLWAQIVNDKDIKNPSAFLYTVVKNLITDHYRTKERGAISLEEHNFDFEDKGKHLEEEMEIKDDVIKVKAALTSLDDNYRQVLSMYYIEQESIKDVAKSLKKSEGATRVMLHRGLKKLKKHLED